MPLTPHWLQTQHWKHPVQQINTSDRQINTQQHRRAALLLIMCYSEITHIQTHLSHTKRCRNRCYTPNCYCKSGPNTGPNTVLRDPTLDSTLDSTLDPTLPDWTQNSQYSWIQHCRTGPKTPELEATLSDWTQHCPTAPNTGPNTGLLDSTLPDRTQHCTTGPSTGLFQFCCQWFVFYYIVC